MEVGMMVQALRVGVVVAFLGALGILLLKMSWAERHASVLPDGVDPSDHMEAPNLDPFADLRATSVWGLTIVLSILFVAMGLPKLGGANFAIHQFEAWGYSSWFRQLIGGTEFFCAIMLLIPRAAMYAAMTLSAIMLGSIFTHLFMGEIAMSLVPLVCLFALLYVAGERAPIALGQA